MAPFLDAYKRRKKALPGRILLAHYGFFYEAAYEDAVTVSQVLHLPLTEMKSISKGEVSIPMVGFPEFKLAGYVQKLKDSGYSPVVEDLFPQRARHVYTHTRTNDA